MAHIIGMKRESGVQLELQDTDHAPISDFHLSKSIAERLVWLYPYEKTGHVWLVRVDSGQGILIVQDMTDLSGHGYIEKLSALDTYDSIMRKAMLIGGEINERTLKREDSEGIRLVTRLDGIPDREQPVPIFKP